LLALLLASLSSALSARAAQDETEVAGPVQADASPQLFATMCATYAAGLDVGGTSVDADPFFTEVRARLLQVHGPATDALRKYYKDHALASPSATLSRYITFAIVAGPPPTFALTVDRLDLPPDVLELDGFSQILANFYKEAQIDELWRLVQPAYEKNALSLREPLGRIVLTGTGYLRELVKPGTGTFTVYPEPLVGGQTQFRSVGNRYGIVVDPKLDSFDLMRHAFLRFLLDPLPVRYPGQMAADEPLFRIGATAPRLPPEFRSSYADFFTECLVRAVELKLQRLPPDRLAQELDRADGDGYVLIRPLMAALAKFETSEPPMSQYFPELVRSIDVNAERKRLQTVAFAPAPDGNETALAEGHGVRDSSPASEVNAALAEGERSIAARNPAAAAEAFQRVLAKQPAQPRALYGLAITSLLQGDAVRARELFEQVVTGAPGTAGEPTSGLDPVAVAWSHVYLGRMHDLDGDRDQALADYRAALAVSGVPDDARSAAQRGIEQSYQLAAPGPSPG
jgi:Tetratricopeptide repeat